MKELIKELKNQEKTISVAESCTGGLISKMITDVSGASEVYGMGVTTYSNEAKMKLLGVNRETLDKFGAVSEETVREMAVGALKLAGSDISISVSGIAGPKSDNTNKPVGMVCIGIATSDRCFSKTFYFKGTRKQIRNLSAKTAIELALSELK